MTRFRFVHAADLHLDTPFERVGRFGGEVGAFLRDASLLAFDNLIDFTLEREAAFLLLAGDIYDGAERGLRAQYRFLDGLQRLAEAGVATFICHGNHDPVEEGWSAIADWPEGITVFPSGQPETAEVRRDGHLLATVSGISYARREVEDNLARLYARPADSPYAVGLLHCNVGGNAEHAAYSPCTLDDLAAGGMDYWALGHIHARQVLQAKNPVVAYSGNLQGRSFKPSERGEKGALLVEVDGGGKSEISFHALDVARFDGLDVDIAGATDLMALRERIIEAANQAHAGAEGRRLLLRCRLVGRGALHQDINRAEALDELLAAAREGLSNTVLLERIESASLPALDLEQIEARGEADFSASVLAAARELSGDPAALEAFAAEAFGAVPRGLRDILEPPGADELAELLERARIDAVDGLEGEAG